MPTPNKPAAPSAPVASKTAVKPPVAAKVSPALAARRLANTASSTAADTASANNPLFSSIDGSDIHVDLPDGGKAIIHGGVPRTLPKKFWRAAQRAGAMTAASMAAMKNAPVAGIEDDPIKRKEAIKAEVVKSLDIDPESEDGAEAFTPSGLPNASWLSTKVGFTVSREERDDIWNEVQVDLEKEDEAGGAGKTRDSDDERDNA